ncbi:hypothetical protein [Tabrizicola caldifontis]|uniref:hypothetical protein n=1 Tax=Tabrizicola caldifontis TaxID=2528036 RepID=UPI001081A9D2|nr:hypothetical protein [Rhodobacter sp. YIM 73028]
MLRCLAALALLAAPVQAEMLGGADDPAFRAALTTLLAADDPAAVATLRDLAEAGNAAALVTLPLALIWVPPQGNLKEKNAQRQVGGVKAQDAAAEAHGATALWDLGRTDTPEDLPDRAAGLLAAGEPEKAAVLLRAWVNMTGAFGDLPPQLLSDDSPAMLGAFALTSRLTAAVYQDGSPLLEAGLLLSLMREDRLAAWMAYVQLLETEPRIFDIIGSPLAGTGLSAADTEARIEDARAVRAVWFGYSVDDIPTPAATATRARDALQGRTELRPVTDLCQAHCPGSLATCEAAMLAFPGLPDPGFTVLQPFSDALNPAEFAASDRGLLTLIRPRHDRAAAADRATSEALDACYAGVLKRRDQISLGP